MSFVPCPNYNVNLFKTSTLLVPTVSIGNVPQLATDLMLHTFGFERVGFLDDNTVMPIAGLREDIEQPGVIVPIEVFQTKDAKWTIIQQRSPTIKGKRTEYLENINQFASRFSRVIVYTSMDASRRLDSQIQGEPFRVYGEGPLLIRAVTLGIPVLENIELEEGQDTNNDKSKLHLPGSGLARHIYEKLADHVNMTLVIMFALEGDNVQDGIEYARFLNTLLKIQQDDVKQWTIPESWKYLFGTPFNAELYQ